MCSTQTRRKCRNQGNWVKGIGQGGFFFLSFLSSSPSCHDVILLFCWTILIRSANTVSPGWGQIYTTNRRNVKGGKTKNLKRRMIALHANWKTSSDSREQPWHVYHARCCPSLLFYFTAGQLQIIWKKKKFKPVWFEYRNERKSAGSLSVPMKSIVTHHHFVFIYFILFF